MYALLRKDAPFVWSKEADQAFNTLKKIILTLPTLAYPDPHKPYDVHTDASMFRLGAIIVQSGRPVAFASRTLIPAEKNYSTTEQEALCVVYALNHFYPYIYGAVFTIYTDHATLKCILSKKEPKGRIARWVLAIQAFQFTIIHRKGIANKDADALGRRDQVNNQQVSVSNGSYGSSSYDSSSGERDDEDTIDQEISIQNFKCYQKDDQRIQVIRKQGVKRPFLWVNEILYYEYDDKCYVLVK